MDAADSGRWLEEMSDKASAAWSDWDGEMLHFPHCPSILGPSNEPSRNRGKGTGYGVSGFYPRSQFPSLVIIYKLLEPLFL